MNHLLTVFVAISDHLKWDAVFWLPFFFGQSLFILKRMALAIRSPLNPLKSRKQYLYLNWDVLLIRSALEFAVVYFPYRHVPMNTFTSMVHLPFQIPQDSAVVSFLLGFLSDSTMDWLALQDKILGVPIPSWVKETVPQIPQVAAMAETLKKNGGK